MMMQRFSTSILFFCLALLASSALAFVPTHTSGAPSTSITSQSTKTSLKAATDLFTATTPDILTHAHTAAESSSTVLSVATLDPSTILSNVLGGLIGGPAILAVPIVAALSVAALIAFLIISYANPADEDD